MTRQNKEEHRKIPKTPNQEEKSRANGLMLLRKPHPKTLKNRKTQPKLAGPAEILNS